MGYGRWYDLGSQIMDFVKWQRQETQLILVIDTWTFGMNGGQSNATRGMWAGNHMVIVIYILIS